MSTKLYSGFKLEGVQTLEDAFAFIETIRKPLEERLLDKISTEIKSLACLIYDLQKFGLDFFDEKDKDRKPLLTATMRLLDDNRSAREHDRQFVVGLAAVDGIVVGYPFFPENGFDDLIFDHPQVTRFGYWDNTDPDESVSKKDWKQREKIWDEVFKNSSIFNHSMFTMVLADKNYFMPTNEHMESMPDLEKREKAVAHHLAWDEVSKGEEFSPENIVETFDKVNKLAAEKLETIKGKLNEDLKLEDLYHPIPKKENNNNESEGISETSSTD